MAVNMGTNILFPLKGMKQGVDLLTGKTQSTFDPEAERQALSQMGAVQRGVERVASGLNSIVETPAAALRYAGETAVQAGKNLAENFQKEGYGDKLSEAVYRKIKNQLTESAFDPVLLKYVSVPIGTPPDKVHKAYLKLQKEKEMEQPASVARKGISTDTPVGPNDAGSQMMRQTQGRQAIFCTKAKKDLNWIPVSGLQLPEMEAKTDPINITLPQRAEGVNIGVYLKKADRQVIYHG